MKEITMKGKQDMISHLLAAIIPPVVSEVIDRVTKYFDGEPEKKPVSKKKHTYNKDLIDNKVRKSIRDDYKEWMKSHKKIVEGTLITTQDGFTAYVNKKYGLSITKYKCLKIAKGE
jgi:hypothetical protein